MLTGESKENQVSIYVSSQILVVRDLNCRARVLITVIRDIWRWINWSNLSQSPANFKAEAIFLIRSVRMTTRQTPWAIYSNM